MNLSTKAIVRIEEISRSLEAEYEFEKESALLQIQNIPLSVLKETGKCQYPVMIKHTSYDRAEYLVVEIIFTNTQTSNRFHQGRKARIFTTNDNSLFIEGSINKAGNDFIMLSTRLDDEPDWLSEGKIGVYLLHDDFTFRESIKAMKVLAKAEQKETLKMIERLYGEEKCEEEIITDKELTLAEGLNESQAKAVNGILNARHLFLVHGPPGTGKSTTVAVAIQEAVKKNVQILFCAPSNTAVDVMTEKLMERGLKVIRIGNAEKISDKTIKASLDYQAQDTEEYKLSKTLRKKAQELHKMAGKYKRVFGKEEREHRNLLYTEAKKMTVEADEMEEKAERFLLQDAQVICSTPALSNSGLLQNMNFEVLFFDEAGQATDSLIWIPLLKSKKIIMAGDHKQLGPTIKSEEARKARAETSLFESLMIKGASSTLLDVQYRMNEKIMNFSNNKFYKGKLKSHITVKEHTLNANDQSPFCFIDTAGAGYNEENDDKSTSIKNKEEAIYLINYLKKLVESTKENFSIGIISPYLAQMNELKQLVKENSIENVQVSTVDGFQGQEKDLILISCVRSNSIGEIGFLRDYKRMNVALTRARKKLVVIGDSATLGSDKFYIDMMGYAESVGGYGTIWE